VNPILNDVTAKFLLTDSLGQHKIHKRKESLGVKSGAKKIIAIEVKEERKEEKNHQIKQDEYLASKVNVSKYLQD
jgi:hypothetical protein